MIIDIKLILELREYLLEGFIEDVGERTESSPVSHPEYDAIQPILSALIDECAEPTDECVTALDAEPLAGREACLQELIEGVGTC
jgi:hypothetical protein